MLKSDSRIVLEDCEFPLWARQIFTSSSPVQNPRHVVAQSFYGSFHAFEAITPFFACLIPEPPGSVMKIHVCSTWIGG